MPIMLHELNVISLLRSSLHACEPAMQRKASDKRIHEPFRSVIVVATFCLACLMLVTAYDILACFRFSR